MTLISHEIPKQLFPFHDLINDYPYVLAHLIGEDVEYTNFYIQKCKDFGYSILDNSAFELGESVSFDRLRAAWDIVRTSHLVIPDIVNDSKRTIEKAESFVNSLVEEYGTGYDIPFKLIGVLQGKSKYEIVDCLAAFSSLKARYNAPIDIIALPFDTIEGTDYHNVRYIIFRELIHALKASYFKVHLLGLQNYSEYLLYTKEEKEMIKSVDSSAPIIYGWNQMLFGEYGTNMPKPKEKLADNLDRVLTPDEISCINKNVLTIRDIIKRR